MVIRRALALRLAAALSGTLALGLAAPAQAVASEPLDYVALGDSFSAASGVLPLDLSAPLLCARSTANYPNVVAERTGAQLTDVTCGGAQTKHFTESQYPGVAPQLDAVDADTDLVTLTIGGNDNNTFINAIVACGTAGVLSGGKGSPCKDANGDSFAKQIDANTYPALKASLSAVKAKAPQARVAILGYPWIMPAKADPSCFAKMPVAEGDVPYLRELQTHLNKAVQRAASETGATYVDMAAASEGRDACAPRGTRWIEPMLFGTNFVPVHPNALGEAGMAKQAIGALNLK
ncbi:SGNH/GDSL hydrolase family protein [Streptomyces sp. NBC_01381]|uniref:SGNH/GDSL hydrolase family protein n=1 Tax=Streptomyces sp. NBC_01381 TaxID=2903845 RepID=UPI00224FE9FE|nr:SGNH/GDSL hydrolase family protein [Streptomyces sp. NBC_01381]MCX4670092.1 SGNH/GDSL hydrolase family protein [Streptomyces sp. NBC_01381]